MAGIIRENPGALASRRLALCDTTELARSLEDGATAIDGDRLWKIIPENAESSSTASVPAGWTCL